MLNPLQAHATALGQVQAELSTSNGQSVGGTIQYPLDSMGAAIAGTTQPIPALVSVFRVVQRFINGQFSPSLSGTVILAKSDIPPGWNFASGQFITVTAPFCQPRQCKIFEMNEQYLNWLLTVDDQNQGA